MEGTVDSTLIFARHWSLRYTRFHFDPAEKAIRQELEDDVVSADEAGQSSLVMGSGTCIDTLPAEIILQIIARVPFSRTSLLNLRAVNSKLKKVIDESQTALLKAIGDLQYPDAVTITNHSDTLTLDQLLSWRRMTLENQWITQRLISTLKSKGLLFEQVPNWQGIIGTGLNFLRACDHHRMQIMQDPQLSSCRSRELFAEMTRSQLGNRANAIIRYTTCKISECFDYLGLYFVNGEDHAGWPVSLPGTWVADDVEPLHLEDMVAQLGFQPLLALLHPVSPMSTATERRDFVRALLDYRDTWLNKLLWRDLIDYAGRGTDHELLRLKYGLMTGNARQRQAALVSISSSIRLQKRIWKSFFQFEDDREYSWNEYAEANILFERQRPVTKRFVMPVNVDAHDRLLILPRSRTLKELHEELSKDGLLSDYLICEDHHDFLQAAVKDLAHLRMLYKLCHQDKLGEHEICSQHCLEHVDFVKAFRTLYGETNISDLSLDG